MGRAPCCDKANVKKGPWSPEEDAKLKSYIEKHGTGGNWIALPQKIGLKRCGKSCRLRWLNYLRPNIKHGGFSEEEDNIICSLYISIGSRWSIIAAQLPGRTDNDIKNYWNTKLKKKLLGKPRKEGRQSGASRRGGGTVLPEQEPRKAVRESVVVVPSQHHYHQQHQQQHQQPCWAAELPMPMLDDTDPIGKMLSKLNGSSIAGFTPGPFDILQPLQPDLEPSSLNADALPTSVFAPFQGSWGFSSAELEEMLYCNAMRLDGGGGLLDAVSAAVAMPGESVGAAAYALPPPRVAAEDEYYQVGVAVHHVEPCSLVQQMELGAII